MKRFMLISILLLAYQSTFASAQLHLNAFVGTKATVTNHSYARGHIKIGTNGRAPITVKFYERKKGRFPASSKAVKIMHIREVEFLAVNFDKFSRIEIIAP